MQKKDADIQAWYKYTRHICVDVNKYNFHIKLILVKSKINIEYIIIITVF